MSGLAEKTVKGLSPVQIELIKGARDDGRLGLYWENRTRQALSRKGLVQGAYLSPFGVSIREYLINRDAR